MRIICARDYNDMSRKAANIISAQVILKPKSVIGLATGGTPLGAYRQLIEWYNKGDIDFRHCRTVNLDEYMGLGSEDEQSYAYFMRENFFKHINIDMDNTNIPDGLNLDGEAECRRYDRILEELGGVDLQILGLGINGHIAFNEPSRFIYKGTHKIALTQETINSNKRFFASEDMVPRYAYTMGIKSILDAERILLMVSGSEKAEILCQSLIGEIEPAVPASMLQMHKNLIVCADEAALGVMMERAPQMINESR